MRNLILTTLALLAPLAAIASALSQTYNIPWHKIGPGGMSAGGAYAVSGTAGQLDAGNMNGGDFSLSGGFWASIGAQGGVPTNGVGFCSNRITGTLRFNNSNPAILSLLNPPGDEGMRLYYIYADSLPAGRDSTSGYQPTAPGASSDYAVTVDADCTNAAGITYVVTPQVALGADTNQLYQFHSKTSAPVVVGMAGPVLNFEDCLGVVQFNFVDSLGVPVSVGGGIINADGGYVHSSIPNGATQQRFYVRGGGDHSLSLTLNRGTNVYTDRQAHQVNTNLTVGCDEIVNVNIIIPSDVGVGQITGTVDMLREFEWRIPGLTSLGLPTYPDLTAMLAQYGPFGNERWTTVAGDNSTLPASGVFQLSNLEPSTADPASTGYAVQGQMAFRTNRTVESFWTPGLGWGSNPAVAVAPGATVNLSNIFQIDPGYMRGAIRLQGPAETPGHASMLRGIYHDGDEDANHDGIPDLLGNSRGVVRSLVEYDGVDRRATGAHYTAAHGYGWGDFDGNFEAPSSAFWGRYELALGGLQGERSIWRPSYFRLTLYETSPDDFYNNYTIAERSSHEIEVVPNQPVTNDLAYGFSEVLVRIYSPSASFTQPFLYFFGGLTGTNFLGQPADYRVDWGLANGAAYAAVANQAQIRVLLPEGTYTLKPFVTSGGENNRVALAPVDVTVRAGQRLDLGTCLRLDLTIPTHAASNQLSLAGSVLTGCNNNVVEISYQLNGAAPVTVCNNCGANPTFSFNVPITLGPNTLAVTARDDQGAVSSISGVIQLDETIRIASVAKSGSFLQINFASQAGRSYNVLSTSDLVSGPWTALQTGIAGNGATVQVTIPNAFGQPRRFFRIQSQ